MKSLSNYINESVRPGHKLGKIKKINGLNVQEGAWAIFLDGYKDPNDKSKAVEMIGKVERFFDNDVQVKIGNNYKNIPNNDVVGIMYSYQTQYDNKAWELEDEVNDIQNEVDDLIDQLNQMRYDMEEDIMQELHSQAKAKGYDEESEEYDRLRDRIGSEWSTTSGYDDVEKDLEKKKKELEKARKNLEDYENSEGQTFYRTKYKKGYDGQYEYSLEGNDTYQYTRKRLIR